MPALLLGPWVASVRDDWRVLLTGPGLAVRGGTPPPAWQLALLHPDGLASWTVLLSVPVLLAGLVAMLRRDRASGAMTSLALLGLTGLALGVLAPHLVLATDPAAAVEVTAWPGTGLDLWALCLLFAALLGLDGLSRRLPSGWTARRVLAVALVAVAGAGVVGSAAVAGWQGRPAALRPQADAVPAVVADQATGPLAARMLVLSGDGTPVRYRVVGREPGPVVRPLPGPATSDPALQAAVQATVTAGPAADANLARTRLADLGIGFVALEGRPDPDRLLRLDSTAGLIRLGDQRDLMLWRVLPRQGASAGATVPSARVRLQTPQGGLLQPVPVSGDHARTAVRLPAGAAGRLLVVAEPLGWVRHADVRYAGRELHALPRAQPTDLRGARRRRPARHRGLADDRRGGAGARVPCWPWSCSWRCRSVAAARGGRHEGSAPCRCRRAPSGRAWWWARACCPARWTCPPPRPAVPSRRPVPSR